MNVHYFYCMDVYPAVLIKYCFQKDKKVPVTLLDRGIDTYLSQGIFPDSLYSLFLQRSSKFLCCELMSLHLCIGARKEKELLVG